jgi:hypothetical protein
MCFSPEASFTGGVIISSIGIASMRKVGSPSQLVFASIPLLFGIQQFAEGVVWVGIPRPEFAAMLRAGMYVFLLMARVIWPAIIPLSMLLMEHNDRQKKSMAVLLAMGLTVSVYYSYCLLFLTVAPQINGNHIQYISDFPEAYAVPVFIVYIIAGIVPFFLSSVKRMRVLGALMFVSCLITAIFYREYLTSVWCFFAAIISVFIFWMIREAEEPAVAARP